MSTDIPPAIGKEPGPKPWTDAKFRMLIRGAIRQIYFRWGGRKHALNKVRLELQVPKKDGKGTKKEIWYVCEQCETRCKPAAGKAGHPRIWVDHIDPVVPLTGELPNWHDYIFRTFCGPENFQALCTACHQEKSRIEGKERRSSARQRKNAERPDVAQAASDPD